jgi:hypothetical protein
MDKKVLLYQLPRASARGGNGTSRTALAKIKIIYRSSLIALAKALRNSFKFYIRLKPVF